MYERAYRNVSKLILPFLLLSASPIGAQTFPGTPVVVDSNGRVLGQLVAGGIVEAGDTSLFIAIEVDGRGGILRTSAGGIGFSTLVFASDDCTGPAHTSYLGPLVNASWFSVPNFSGGDLYSFVAEDLVFNFSYGSAFVLGSCQITAGSFSQAVPVTLFQAGWAGAACRAWEYGSSTEGRLRSCETLRTYFCVARLLRHG